MKENVKEKVQEVVASVLPSKVNWASQKNHRQQSRDHWLKRIIKCHHSRAQNFVGPCQ